MRPRQNGRHFPDEFASRILWIEMRESLFINNILPALVQIIAWRRSGDKPLSEPIMFELPTHVCVTRPQ